MGLMKTMTEAGLDKQGPELLQRMTQGVFTLRDMYEQFSNIMVRCTALASASSRHLYACARRVASFLTLHRSL